MVFFDEIMSNLSCRFLSPEEAALLSGRLDVIRKVFENQKVEELMERLSSRAIERNGQFFYREEYGMHLPDAIYWLNEEESLYIDRTYPMLHQYYDWSCLRMGMKQNFIKRIKCKRHPR